MVYVNTINNPFEPYNSQKESIDSGITIYDYLCNTHGIKWERFERPTITVLNGEPVSQKDFEKVILEDNDILCFVVLVGGFDPFTWMVIALVVVSAASVVAVTSMVQPAGVISNDIKSPNSVYNLNGQVNSSKLGQEIPCGYGKVRNWPDYAARPYNLYKNNQQYQYSLLCLGHGEYDIEDIKIGDTPIANFEEIEYEIIKPNEKVDLFRDSVVTSIEAANIELLGSNEAGYAGDSGPYVINAATTKINKIELDLSFPRGLYEQKSDGTLASLTVTASISYREIDDTGSPVANPVSYKAKKTVTEIIVNDKWVTSSVVYTEIAHAHPNGYKEVTYDEDPLGDAPHTRITVYYINRSTTWEIVTFTKTLKSITPKRLTVEIDVPYGRYEIKIVRTSTKYKQFRYSNTLILEAVRGFMPNTSYYGNKTLIALKALATNNLNNNSAKQLNLVQTRKLRQWTVSGWTGRTATRNPVWCAVDALKARYGGRIADTYIDLPTFKTLADFCAANSLNFDYVFSTRSNVWDIVKTILAVAKMTPVLKNSKVSAIRDYELEFPEYIYTDDNIIKDSFQRSLAMKKLSDYDGLEVEFVNGTNYKQETTLCLVDDDAGNNIENLKIIGVTDKNKAHRLGLYHRAMKKYRRELISFKTDAQGYLPTLNSLIGICHNTTKYRGFDLVKTVVGNVITLHNKHTFDLLETHQITFKQRTGFASPVYDMVPDSAYTDTLTVTDLAEDLSRLDGEEPLICQFGESGKLNKLVRVKSINPIDINTVEIQCVTNDNRIYGFDAIDDDPTVVTGYISDEDLPIIGDLLVEYKTVGSSKAVVTWPLHKSAKSYVIQYSYDNIEWSKAAKITDNKYVFVIVPGQLYIRVAGINKGRGPWSEWDGILSDVVSIPDKIYNVALKGIPEDSFTVVWDGDKDAQEYIIKAYTGWSTSESALVGQKVITLPLSKQLLKKHCIVEFTKDWLKNRCLARDKFFGREWTFTVSGKNTLGTGTASDALAVFKEPLSSYQPYSLTKDLVSGNIYNVGWTELGNPTDEVYYKVWTSTVNGSYPPGMTLRKTTKNNTAQITITSTRPTYFRIQVLDNWDTDEAVVASNQATIFV